MSETRPTKQEITYYHESIGANFGDTSPFDVVRFGLLKIACGWHSGFTCKSILKHHGLVVWEDDETKLTEAGREFLWDAFNDVPTCKWEYVEDSHYETQCDQAHQFMNDGPKENEHWFCPYCGKPIEVRRRVSIEDLRSAGLDAWDEVDNPIDFLDGLR